ncbi:MAG: ABC transporter substrate-binding protein [Christensenellales bacterium]
MKKLWKKIVCIALAAVTVLPVAACGKPKRPRSETLTITVSNLGFGTTWLDAIVREFKSIYDVDVEVHPTIDQANLLTQLEVDYQLDDLCMFAGVSAVWDTMRKGKFMELDDVWADTVEGESKTIAEKALPELAEAYKFQNHYYSMPFITEMGGMAYNKNTLDKLYGAGNWTLPTTTEELNEMCADIVSKGAYRSVEQGKFVLLGYDGGGVDGTVRRSKGVRRRKPRLVLGRNEKRLRCSRFERDRNRQDSFQQGQILRLRRRL